MANADEMHTRATLWRRWVARIRGGLVLVVAVFILAGYASTCVTTDQANRHPV